MAPFCVSRPIEEVRSGDRVLRNGFEIGRDQISHALRVFAFLQLIGVGGELYQQYPAPDLLGSYFGNGSLFTLFD